MSWKYTPGPWCIGTDTSIGARAGRVHVLSASRGPFDCVAVAETEANAYLIAAAPELLALAAFYATECGECAGTRVMPDDQPCTDCAFIWAVIDKARGRA